MRHELATVYAYQVKPAYAAKRPPRGDMGPKLRCGALVASALAAIKVLAGLLADPQHRDTTAWQQSNLDGDIPGPKLLDPRRLAENERILLPIEAAADPYPWVS